MIAVMSEGQKCVIVLSRRESTSFRDRPSSRESTSFDNDCKFTYSFTAHMHEIPKYVDKSTDRKFTVLYAAFARGRLMYSS